MSLLHEQFFFQVSSQLINIPEPTNVQQTPDGDFYAEPLYNYAYEVSHEAKALYPGN